MRQSALRAKADGLEQEWLELQEKLEAVAATA
jgi:hypothetical protein